MRKELLFIFYLFLYSATTQGQSPKLWTGVGLNFFGGVAYGLSEAAQHDPDGFKSRFPLLCPGNYCDIRTSHMRKYNADGSLKHFWSRWIPFGTDFDHTARGIRTVGTVSGTTVITWYFIKDHKYKDYQRKRYKRRRGRVVHAMIVAFTANFVGSYVGYQIGRGRSLLKP